MKLLEFFREIDNAGIPLDEAWCVEAETITAYHATPSDIKRFRPMTHFGTPGAARHYFKTRPTPGTRTYRVKLQMENPALMYDTREEHYNPAAYLDGLLALFTNDDKARDFYRLKPGANPNNFSPEELRELITEYEKDASEWLKRNGGGIGPKILGPTIRANRDKLERELFRPWRKRIAAFLRSHGHDGIKYKNRVEGRGTWSYINLTPGQVKHATVKEATEDGEWIVTPSEFAAYVRERYSIVFDLRARGKIVDLENIQTSRRAAPGTGTQAMEELTEWADANQVLLTLSLAEKGHSPEEGWKKTTSRGRLERFYRRFGFISNRGRNKRFDLSMYASMYRKPGPPPTSLSPNMQGTITDCHSGECFGSVTASFWGKVIGVIDLSIYQGTASIKWIRVDEQFQRQAIATKMVHYVRQWLDMPVEFMGGTTPSGQGLYQSLKRRGIIERSKQATVQEALNAHVLPEKVYHGTVGTEKAEKIMKDGINAQRVMQPRTHLAPVPGRVYASQTLEYAMIYAMGGQMAGHVDPRVPEKDPYGYVFVIDRSEILDDVQPDEDSVGEAWMFADMAAQGDKEDLRKFYWSNPLARAIYNSEGWDNFGGYVHRLGRSVASPKTLSYVKNGEYVWFAKLGKMMLRKMDDKLKEMFLINGAHVSVRGPLIPSQIWRLDRRRTVDLKPDGSNFFQVAERIR